MDAQERTILEAWDGPLCVEDRYFADEEDAVQHYWDDAWNKETDSVNMDDVPEFIECCGEKLPSFTSAEAFVDEIIENIDENNPVAEDSTGFFDHVEQKHRDDLVAKLNETINEWIKSVDWKYWTGNGTYMRLRPLVAEYEREQNEA